MYFDVVCGHGETTYGKLLDFKSDDVTEFLLRIKTVLYKKSNDNIISLPKGKLHGKHENLTINYDFDAFDDIERPMMRPSTPDRRSSDRDSFRSKDYVIVTKPKNSSRQQYEADVDLHKNVYLGPDHLRADSVDITLDDNHNSSNGQFGDFSMEILEEERLPATDHDPMDFDFLPEILLSEEIKAPLSAEIQGNSTESQEQQPDQDPRTDLEKSPSKPEEIVGPESPDHGEDTTGTAATTRKKRKRQVRTKHNIVHDECLEIPAPVFATWLRDREDIIGRGTAQKKNSDASRVEKLFRLPSASLSHWTCFPGLEPEWTDDLLDLWNMDIGAKSEGDRHFRDLRSRKALPLVPGTSVQGIHSKSCSDPSDGQPEGEFHLVSSSKTRANVEPDVEKPQEVPTENGGNSKTRDALDSVEHFPSGQLHVRDHGSVEKLRAALRSPSPGSEDQFGGSQLGLTPSLSGQFGTNAGGRPNRSVSTPGSGKLPFDVEVEPSTGGSGRFVKARLSSPAIGLGDFPADNYFAENDIPVPDALGSSAYFSTLRGTLRGSLTQFDLAEETAASAQLGSGKQDGTLNNVSLTVLQCLRQNFNELGARCKEYQSLDDLVQEMDRSEAAKLFYHILALRSNNYLEVSQDVPYGDIRLSRGPYL